MSNSNEQSILLRTFNSRNRCINCTLLIPRNIRRYPLDQASNAMVTLLQSWITPTQLSQEYILCTECFGLLENRVNMGGETFSTLPTFGHRSICFPCGKSILRAQRTYPVHRNREESNILTRLVPHHLASPHGSVMSCQSLATRAFTDHKDNMTHCSGFHRSVRFSSESRSSTRASNEEKKENAGSISLTALAVTPITSSAMTQSAPPPSATFDLDETPAPPPSSCRFPKLEECAHFHYERVCLGGISIELVPCDEDCNDNEEEGWVYLKVRSHVNSGADSDSEVKPLNTSWTAAADVGEWTLSRNRDNLLRLDEMLHRCIYDRKVSGLPNLSAELTPTLDQESYRRLISDYMHHLCIIADDSINCGPVLNWLQMDNRGHKLLVANEDSSSINTPAVAAAYSVRKYVSQARDEISFEVGDMISIIDMPGPQESLWWRGKRGFRVGFFPHHCVAVIGDKVPRHMTQPPPIVGSVMVQPIKPVLRKHGKLISLFRSFILSRPSRPSLKQQGILKERVFGCDLGEHLLNSGYDVPLVLTECAAAIESRGAVDGVYRLSGGSGLTQRLRAAFDAGADSLPAGPDLARDPHAVPSLLKMYFRELPNPLCTYQLYESFVAAMQQPDEFTKLRAVRQTVVKLPPPHYRTLAYLMRHLRRISLLGEQTGMTPRNMAIVWAPNLLRAPRHQHALQGVAVQAVVTEFLICYAEELFAQEQGADSEPESLEPEPCEVQVELRGSEGGGRRPKSLPVNPPTKLLSLEEARRRGVRVVPASPSPLPPSGAIAAAANTPTLRPSTSHKPKYIEVGSGPNNLPQYHTVLDLPISGSKRGLKRSPSGWRGLFTRTNKQQRSRASRPVPEITQPMPIEDVPMCSTSGLRPVKSCESLTSETDIVPPLSQQHSNTTNKHHTRSASCDSYFEPWQAELADMRLRLAPQERDHHMFSEEDDTNILQQGDSVCSTPPESGLCSVEPSPRRNLRVDIEAANGLHEKRLSMYEEQAGTLRYIDGESPVSRPAPEKRPSLQQDEVQTHQDLPKRLCKDRETSTEVHNTANVKLRERNSPRKTKSSRYSNFHDDKIVSRLSWHGKDGHSTLIKIDWPVDNSLTNLTTMTNSTINSSPITPITPVYDPLETDSEISEKHTITVKNDCNNCDNTCLKCELKATDYNTENKQETSSNSDISYQNLNRLSVLSNSSSDQKEKNADKMTSSHDRMTSSHESSSSYSNHDYECFNFSRPNYINLNTSSSKSSPTSPLKSPLKSTISITFRSPTKSNNDDRDSVYEDIDIDKNLSIVEDATVPGLDASLPTQQAFQPDDLIILETPTPNFDENLDVYSQVKFFKKSIEEVNALVSPEKEEERHYENVNFESQNIGFEYQNVESQDGYGTLNVEFAPQNVDFKSEKLEYENASFQPRSVSFESHNSGYEPQNISFEPQNASFPQSEYENINVDTLNICDKLEINETEKDNGNSIKNSKNLNVRELAIRFESPTEVKGPFTFEKFKTEIKYPSLERSEKDEPQTHQLSKSSARSLDENAFSKEFGQKDRRKSLEVKQKSINIDLNLNVQKKEPITPTNENKISLIQRFNEKRPTEIKNLITFDTEKKLSRERIEKYKEERRNFLREKYSSQSFRSNPDQLTRIKIKKDKQDSTCSPKFERRNTVDLGTRMRFSLAKSANDIDIIQSPVSPKDEEFDRKEKVSPSFNIRDMTALFEHKTNNGTG